MNLLLFFIGVLSINALGIGICIFAIHRSNKHIGKIIEDKIEKSDAYIGLNKRVEGFHVHAAQELENLPDIVRATIRIYFEECVKEQFENCILEMRKTTIPLVCYENLEKKMEENIQELQMMPEVIALVVQRILKNHGIKQLGEVS